MTAPGIPDSIERFIREHLRSVEQLEVLLLLYRTTPREWTAVSTSRELRIDAITAARGLADVQQQGLVSVRAGEEALLYWYEGSSRRGDDRTIEQLETFYRERPTAIINLIQSAPVNDLRLFADAFRVRRPKGGGGD